MSIVTYGFGNSPSAIILFGFMESSGVVSTTPLVDIEFIGSLSSQGSNGISNELQIGNVGVRIIYTVKEDDVVLDLTDANTLEIVLQSPAGVSNTYTASLFTDGTDGKIYYDTQLSDISQAGTWKVQAKTTFDAGTYYTDISSFKVYANL